MPTLRPPRCCGNVAGCPAWSSSPSSSLKLRRSPRFAASVALFGADEFALLHPLEYTPPRAHTGILRPDSALSGRASSRAEASFRSGFGPARKATGSKRAFQFRESEASVLTRRSAHESDETAIGSCEASPALLQINARSGEYRFVVLALVNWLFYRRVSVATIRLLQTYQSSATSKPRENGGRENRPHRPIPGALSQVVGFWPHCILF